jgi:hypothetical protein
LAGLNGVGGDTDQSGSHLETLRNLPINTAIYVRDHNGKQKKHYFEGVELVGGTERVRVRPVHGSVKTLVPTERVARLQLTQRGDFLSRAMPGIDAGTLASTSQLDCAVIGPVATLHAEVEECCFAYLTEDAGDPSTVVSGCIHDILRVKRLCGKNEHHRTHIVAMVGRAAKALATMVPAVVIFDGARSFVNCRNELVDRPWLVVLDRTEPRFRDAAFAVNDYYRSRVDSPAPKLPLPPPGVDSMSFWRGVA